MVAATRTVVLVAALSLTWNREASGQVAVAVVDRSVAVGETFDVDVSVSGIESGIAVQTFQADVEIAGDGAPDLVFLGFGSLTGTLVAPWVGPFLSAQCVAPSGITVAGGGCNVSAPAGATRFRVGGLDAGGKPITKSGILFRLRFRAGAEAMNAVVTLRSFAMGDGVNVVTMVPPEPAFRVATPVRRDAPDFAGEACASVESVYPVPARERATVRWSTGVVSDLEVTAWDLAGRARSVRIAGGSSSAGGIEHALDVTGWARGVHVVRLTWRGAAGTCVRNLLLPVQGR